MTDERMPNPLPVFDGEVGGASGCPRGRDDCWSISRYASRRGVSFMCCGETNAAPVPTDRLRLCIKSTHKTGVDVMVNLDERDAVHTSAVLLSGLSYRGSIGLVPLEVPPEDQGADDDDDGEPDFTTDEDPVDPQMEGWQP